MVVSQGSQFGEVSPTGGAGLRDRGAVLLDIREPEEWEAGHAHDAVHVPLAEVETTAARFAGQEGLTICRSGGRSAKAAETLAREGIDVRNVTGGITAWAGAGLPVVRDDGAPGAVV